MEFTVILEKGENGYIIASCPSLPGCHTQGNTEAEALHNIREAIIGCLLTLNDRASRGAQACLCPGSPGPGARPC